MIQRYWPTREAEGMIDHFGFRESHMAFTAPSWARSGRSSTGSPRPSRQRPAVGLMPQAAPEKAELTSQLRSFLAWAGEPTSPR